MAYIVDTTNPNNIQGVMFDGGFPVNPPDPPTPEHTEGQFKFLHISDLHTCVDSLTKCKNLMEENNDTIVTMLTGDYGQLGESFGNMNANMAQALENFNHSLLLINGNHEVYDVFGGHSGSGVRSAAATALNYLKTHVIENNVEWGANSSNPTGAYYYVDYTLSDTSILRVVALDMYDGGKLTSAEANTFHIYDNAYSREQINWFIQTISGLSANDYLIVLLHEPPVGYSTDPLEGSGSNKKFCSSNLKTCSSFSVCTDTIPYIMNAYLHGENMQNKHFLRYDSDTTGFNITYDFSPIAPCTFIGYLCGHIHGDFHDYHPTYNDQLIMCIDWGNDATNNKVYWSDIYNTNTPHRKDGVLINEVALNFETRKITITRIGNGSGKDGYGKPTSGVARDTITFDM